MFTRFAALLIGPSLLLAASLCAMPSAAAPVSSGDIVNRSDAPPQQVQGLDVHEQLGAELPRELGFTTSDARRVKLGELLDGSRPTIVTLNYSNCPMLCSLLLNGLAQSLKRVDRRLGQDYSIVTVLLDPKETPASATVTKDRYLSTYLGSTPDPKVAEEARRGWQFLTGTEANIKAVAAALGVRYGYNAERGEYIHPAAITLLTPAGKVARYLYGIEYHPQTLSLSLVDVSEGKIGGSMDKILLYCFHYDATEGRYDIVAMNIMRLSGGLAALVLGAFLGRSWLRESRRQRAHAAS